MRACLIFMVLCLLSGCAGGAPRTGRLSVPRLPRQNPGKRSLWLAVIP